MTLLIDTPHVLVTGRGQTPLLHPKVGVQAGKPAGQAGGALALGALLTPVAALLAFVDGELAKDANCAALISQVEQGKNIPQE